MFKSSLKFVAVFQKILKYLLMSLLRYLFITVHEIQMIL